MASVAALEPQLILKHPSDFSTPRGGGQFTKTLPEGAQVRQRLSQAQRMSAGDEPLAITILKKEIATEIANAIRSGHEKRE